MKNRFVIIIIVILVLSIKVMVLGYFFYIRALDSTIKTDSSLVIEIPKGTGLTRAIELFNKQGELMPPQVFQIYIRLYAKTSEKHLMAGSFKFDAGMTNRQVVEGLFSTKYFNTIKVSFPEGMILERYAKIIQEQLNMDSAHFMLLAKSDSLLRARNIKSNSLEGWLLPDTYTFFKDITIYNVIDALLDAQNKKWNETWNAKAEENNLSRLEVLTLASIVEAESPVVDERPIVAGLYLNRLRKGMLLQADPTVQYALRQWRRLLYKDLEFNHPYNTYIYSGLPPGPINSPGVTAIDAVLNPEQHNYLFMVAKGDGSGEHNFAVTYQQHLRYVAEFRRNVR
jgi:UPF0755 protein